MINLFVDTDVCIDLLSGRKPFNSTAEILFTYADHQKIKIFVSALSFSNIDYVLRSHYSTVHSRQLIGKFKTLVHVLPIDNKTIDLALSSDFNDFEDAIQYFCAIENNLTTLVTRNVKDYKKATISVMTPESFIALMCE